MGEGSLYIADHCEVSADVEVGFGSGYEGGHWQRTCFSSSSFRYHLLYWYLLMLFLCFLFAPPPSRRSQSMHQQILDNPMPHRTGMDRIMSKKQQVTLLPSRWKYLLLYRLCLHFRRIRKHRRILRRLRLDIALEPPKPLRLR